ncbi:Uncharacterized protein Rs2_14223 [Raphanus sativus]|uniref:Uncharacterized protein LOC108852080 n=1 Tax=Raphanus sativus TaxID=3726 RepID=A0A6J0N981_RAPSA|nr:uncharacterized protein LOC108852080 [Raphanus sativus]KAJ4900272.1 Uncharacterized protein Rs2_14223 [Raphanus sativus]
MGDRGGGGDSSSEEEDDPKWKAAINSIVTTTAYAASATKAAAAAAATQQHEDGEFRLKPKKLTHAQIKVKKLLNEMVENTLDFVKDPTLTLVPQDDEEPENDCGVRLFKRCSTGIVFDHVDELQGPKKKPNLHPSRGLEASSKEFKKRIESIAVDGSDVLSAAVESAKKASARLEAKEAAAKAKAKKEEERVAELKKVRGEKWLPSVARALQLNKNSTGRSAKS